MAYVLTTHYEARVQIGDSIIRIAKSRNKIKWIIDAPENVKVITLEKGIPRYAREELEEIERRERDGCTTQDGGYQDDQTAIPDGP